MMLDECEINNLVTNIINQNSNSHCRLCLKLVDEYYVSLQNNVCINGIFQPLCEVLTKLLGEKVYNETPALNSVCVNCVNKTLEATKFLETCKKSSKLLHNVFDNLIDRLNSQIKGETDNQALYIIVGEHHSQVFLMNIQQKKKNNNINKSKSFQCHTCNTEYENLEELKEHYILCHGLLLCEKCLETFSDDAALNIHVSSKHKYKCPQCQVCKTTEEGFKMHQDKTHNVYICKECGKTYKGLDRLKMHEEKHNINMKYECATCGKTYHTKDFFIKHVKLCVDGLLDPHPIRSEMAKPFSCAECGKSYSTSGGLRVHSRFVHGNAKHHVCDQCGKKFTAPSSLKIHMIKHTRERNFKCNICANKFVSKEALLYHTRRHTGEKPYSCKFCHEKFVNASARAEHIKFKHVGPTMECNICNRKFVTTHFLKQHITRHSDPTSKLYIGRTMVPPNVPAEENIRYRIKND